VNLFYELSEDDRILAVCDGWDDFGRANNASKLGADVIGYPIWQFISGQDTRSYMNSIFFSCRSYARPLTALYRGDSPEMMRVYRMTVAPLPDLGLRLTHHLTAEMPHWHDPPVRRIPRALVQCSQCLSLQTPQAWAPGPGPAFRAKGEISYHVCPDCRQSLSRQIERTALRGGAASRPKGGGVLMA
jgi:hypothetical protein